MSTSERDREFGAFVAARSAALLRTAYLVTGHRQAAEDLLQTALAKTYLAWSRIDSPESVEAYVRRVMVTTHISWWRRHHGRERLLEDLPEPVSPGQDLPDERFVEHDRVWRALAELSDRQRTVLVLRYYEELSEAEIAQLMGCSKGSVKTHASRGLAGLRTLLGPAAEPSTALHRIGGAS